MRLAVVLVMLSLATPVLADAVAQTGAPASGPPASRRLARPARPVVQMYKEKT